MPQRIPIVNTIITKESQILMLKRKYYPKNKLDLPGGFVDKNEDLQAAAIREVKEETGFDVKITNTFGQYDYFDRGNKTMHVFLGSITRGELRESNEGTPLWKSLSKIHPKDLAFPQVHKRILDDFISYTSSSIATTT